MIEKGSYYCFKADTCRKMHKAGAWSLFFLTPLGDAVSYFVLATTRPERHFERNLVFAILASALVFGGFLFSSKIDGLPILHNYFGGSCFAKGNDQSIPDHYHSKLKL